MPISAQEWRVRTGLINASRIRTVSVSRRSVSKPANHDSTPGSVTLGGRGIVAWNGQPAPQSQVKGDFCYSPLTELPSSTWMGWKALFLCLLAPLIPKLITVPITIYHILIGWKEIYLAGHSTEAAKGSIIVTKFVSLFDHSHPWIILLVAAAILVASLNVFWLLLISKPKKEYQPSSKGVLLMLILLLQAKGLIVQSSLLLRCGDIETNPGPGLYPDLDYDNVDDSTVLTEDDFREVHIQAVNVHFCYYQLGTYLGLPQREVEGIRMTYNTNINQAFIEVLLAWLRQRYNVEKYGPPTWRRLVEAVDNPAGGNNHALAKTIADHHPVKVVDKAADENCNALDKVTITDVVHPSSISTACDHDQKGASKSIHAMGKGIAKGHQVTLKNARSALYPARAKWRDIGIELEIDTGTLDSIERSFHLQDGNCLTRMLENWFKQTDPPPSWDAIVEALESDPVNEGHLADQIKQKYCKSKSECVAPPHTATAGDSQAKTRTKCKNSPQESDSKVDDDDILGGIRSNSECVPPPRTVTAGDSQAKAKTKRKNSPQEKDNDDDDDDILLQGYDYHSGRSWASRDTQRYRSGYRDTDDLHLDRNYKFYTNQIRSEPDGDLIENIHDNWIGNYTHLEVHHGYIQWLFPIRERGSNWHAQELQPHEIKRICDDPVAHKRILTSYELMLDFYGMKLQDPETGEIERADNWMARFRHLNRSMHNYLRITRILKCLGEFDYEHLKAPFVRFVLHEAIVERTLDNTIDSCLNYWLEMIKDDKERKQIKKYARELLLSVRGNPKKKKK